MKPTTEKCVRVSPLILTFTIECDDLPRGSSSLRPLDSERAVTVQYGSTSCRAFLCSSQVKSLHTNNRQPSGAPGSLSNVCAPEASWGGREWADEEMAEGDP